jgi:hypothetical protein
MRDIAMALVGAEMEALGTQRLAPVERVALVAVMAEPDRARDLRHVRGTISAVAAKPLQARISASQPMRSGAVRSDATSTPVTRACVARRASWHGGCTRYRRPISSQAARRRSTSSRPASRRQPVHPAARMAGVVEIIDQRERQPKPVGQPFHRRTRPSSPTGRRGAGGSLPSPCAGCRRRSAPRRPRSPRRLARVPAAGISPPKARWTRTAPRRPRPPGTLAPASFDRQRRDQTAGPRADDHEHRAHAGRTRFRAAEGRA